MSERTTDPDPLEDPDSVPGTPRWVKVFGIIAIVVVLLVGFILFSGIGGPHGPQRHAASSDGGGHSPPSVAYADRHIA